MLIYKKGSMKLKLSEILTGTLIFTLVFGFFGYSFIEPMFVEAVTDEVIISLEVSSNITISDASNATMTPSLSLTNDTANASTAWTVTTNDADGYTLTVQSSTDPALRSTTNPSTDFFDDYTEIVGGTPEQWSVSSAYEFGFSAYGNDVPTGTWGTDQSSCGTDGPLVGATRLYRGLDGSNTIQIASSNSTTSPSGTSSTVCWAVEQESVTAPSGTYQATITATALVQ